MSKLFCDCKTDEEKSNFFLSGQGVETGIIAPAISNEVAMAFHRCFELEKQLAAAYEAGKRDASEDLEQAAFEKWLHDKCPSGDVESVQRQWLKSYEYAEFAGKLEQASAGMLIESLRQQLAAAHAARVSAQASGIRLLDQLTAAKEECNTLRRIHAENIAILERKTAQAVAACKLKDEELEKIRGHIGLYNLFSCVGSDSYDPECADLNVGKCREIAIEALTIQPGTEALEKWLGEPVAFIFQHEDTGRTMCIDAQQVEWNFEKNNPRLFKCGQLYYPKGLK